MIWWVLFAVVLGIALVVATLAWWRIGDQWADAEHKKFAAKPRDPNAPKPRVIKTGKPPSRDRPRP